MTGSERYFKCLRVRDGQLASCHGGTQIWPPGEWVQAPGPLALCQPGTLHACRPRDLLSWLTDEIWHAEIGGDVLEGEDKVGCLRMRITTRCAWDTTAARLFAADCAERVLPIYERAFPTDRRPRAAIEAARLFAAAWDAAGDAARAAAWNAAEAAAGAAGAGDAAWAAARAAAWAAGAGDAAWAAAEDAARAAAWDAAEAAAEAAAGDAAGDAERDWQTQRLTAYLDGWRPEA